MTKNADIWDCPAGEERITTVRLPTVDPRKFERWVLYCYTAQRASTNLPFAWVARTAETARVKRDIWLEQNCLTIPRPKRTPAPERVPASECEDVRCNDLARARYNERGGKLDVAI